MSPFEATIGEINIVCSSIEASLAFYRDVLGFKQLSEDQGCWHMSFNGVPFLLLPFAQPNNERPVYMSVPAISIDLVVADLGVARSFLSSKNVEIIDDSQDEGCFFIRDPDGLVLEIVQAHQ